MSWWWLSCPWWNFHLGKGVLKGTVGRIHHDFGLGSTLEPLKWLVVFLLSFKERTSQTAWGFAVCNIDQIKGSPPGSLLENHHGEMGVNSNASRMWSEGDSQCPFFPRQSGCEGRYWTCVAWRSLVGATSTCRIICRRFGRPIKQWTKTYELGLCVWNNAVCYTSPLVKNHYLQHLQPFKTIPEWPLLLWQCWSIGERCVEIAACFQDTKQRKAPC